MVDNEFNDYENIEDDFANAKDEFSELDYRPRKGFSMIKSGLVILVAIIAVIMAVIYFGDSSFQAIVDDTEQEDVTGENGESGNAELEEEQVDEPDQNNGEEVDLNSNNGEDGEDGEDVGDAPDPGIADPTKLEPILKGWIVERTADPQIILLSDAELEDVEGFFEEYDLENDNIVVYKVDSIDDEFAIVLFGIPFSEWSIKAVFTWRDGKWVFLREEPV